MASIGTLFPTPTSSGATTPTTAASASSTGSSNSLTNQNTFLTLLVAQLQHQDPTQPVDGTTFVTQLATFTDLQANLGSKSDLDSIAKQYLSTASTGTGTTSGTGTSSGSTGTTSGTPAETSTTVTGS